MKPVLGAVLVGALVAGLLAAFAHHGGGVRRRAHPATTTEPEPAATTEARPVTPAPAPPPASAAAKAAWLATWTRWAREIRADVADVRKHFDRDYGRESDFPGLEARLSPFLTCAYYRDRVPRPPHGLEDVADASAHLCRTLEAAFEIAQEVLAGDADRVPAFDRKLAVAEDEVATLFAASSA